MNARIRVDHPGAGCAMQDLGRPGWKRYGLPAGGAMDRRSAVLANRLVGNADACPVLEMALAGFSFTVLQAGEFALAGAADGGSHPLGRSFFGRAGERIFSGPSSSGAWTYLAVRGGWKAPRWFGSASVNARAGLGRPCEPGTELSACPAPPTAGVACRFVGPTDRAVDSGSTPFLLWPGPEWAWLSADAGQTFLAAEWGVSSQSDRTGYRLEGPVLTVHDRPLVSSPVPVGTIQLPPSGQPIVILRDGPTMGGYPRVAVLDPSEVSRFVQRAPGTTVCFQWKS